MSWSVVQSASSFGTQTGFEAVTYGSNVSSGNKLIAWTVVKLTTTSTVKDGAGNSWTKLASVGLNGSTANGELALWALDCPAGDAGTAPTLTATFVSNLRFGGILVREVSGLLAGNTSAMLDGTAGTTSGAVSANGNVGPPTYSSTAANEFLDYGYGDNGGSTNAPTWTAPAGYTADPNGINSSGVVDLVSSYKNSTNGAETGHYSIVIAGGTANWAEIIVAFKLAAAGGVSGTAQPRATVPAPRRKPARALWQRVTGQAYVQVPAPAQQPRPAPRRKPARAYIRFIPVTTTNAVPAPPAGGTVQPQAALPAPRRRPARAIWRSGSGQAFAQVPAPRQQYRTPPRRARSRAYIRFTPVTTHNAPLHRTLLISLASQAGTDDYGNAILQGIFAAAGIIQGPVFKGSNFIINSQGAFFYSGTPAAGNLILSISASTVPFTDSFGNHCVPLTGWYDNTGGFFSQMGAGFLTYGTGSLAGGWTANTSIQNDAGGNLNLAALGNLTFNGTVMTVP